MFALALIILALTVMTLGGAPNLFRQQVRYVHGLFPSVDGLWTSVPRSR